MKVDGSREGDIDVIEAMTLEDGFFEEGGSVDAGSASSGERVV